MKTEERLRDLSEIRSMMERSAKFISLSGISGVAVGIVGLLVSGTAWWHIDRIGVNLFDVDHRAAVHSNDLSLLMWLGCVGLILALGLATLFSSRLARKKGLEIWSSSTKHLLSSFLVPLAAGGVVALSLWSYGILFLIPPILLIFYGLALVNASKHTLSEIQYLGYAETVLGVVALILVKYGLFFWALGFGVLHIVNGLCMYRKYEQ